MENGKLNTLKIFNFQLSIFNSRVAFTLAEVLITLAVIGVVAAMTIPTLIQKHNEKATVVHLKKTYSMLGQALKLTEPQFGNISEWSNSENLKNIADDWYNILKRYIKVIKYCGIDENSPRDCFANEYKTLNPNNNYTINLNYG